MTGFLSRDAIFAADDFKVEVVDVPEWGGQVKVKGLTGRERDEFETGMFVQRGREMVRDTGNLRARLVVLCALDEAGNPLFERADVKALGEKSGAALDRVYEAAAKLSGIMESDLEEAVADFGDAPWLQFIFGLCEKLGRGEEEFLSVVSSAELTQWQAYFDWQAIVRDEAERGVNRRGLD